MRLGKIMGIPIRIHYTLWLVFALIAWSLATPNGYMPHQYPGLSTGVYWAIGIASAIILFASVLIHELSHSYVAKKNGLPIARITLFFFGGVSEMTEEPQDPGLEVRMAIAGPAMSFVIAAVLGGLWYLSKALTLPVPIMATLGYGALINAVLGAFNLLPAFPLDGGRVFRGSLWKRSNSLIGATRTATRISEILSLLMMLGGFAAIIFGDFVDGIWIVVLGWFIRSGAETSLGQTLVGEALTGVTVSDIMTQNVLTVTPEIKVEQLVQDYFLIYHHDGYPVVKDGEIQGIVTLRCVRAVPKEQRANVTVAQAMVPRDKTIMIKPTQSALDAFQKMARAKVGRLLVADDGKLMGILTRGDVMRTIQTRRELGIGAIRQPALGSQAPPIGGQAKYCVQCGAKLITGTQFCPYCGAAQPKL
jgi:Zn-dependent protease/predicted transcriptional regulator